MSATIAAAAPRPIGAPAGLELLTGARRVGSELRWSVSYDGVEASFAQLAPELARDATVRARFVDDVERMVALDVPAHEAPFATGPAPDPRDPEAAPPWRLRRQPPGVTLDAWLLEHTPASIEGGLALVRAVATAVAQVHARGFVIRDLQPRHVVIQTDGDAVTAAVLVDIGLSRTDTLSSRTAASLLVEDSPYTAPECLRRTTVDRRADLFSLGVLAHVALTGVAPWGDVGAVTRPATPAPAASQLRPELGAVIDGAIAAALCEDPDRRPASVEDWLQLFEGGAVVALALVRCQACGADVRAGQRLCLSCGRQAVQFGHAAPDSLDVQMLVLPKASEEAQFAQRLRDALATIADGELPPLDFLIGDERMYSKRERQARIRLPAKLFGRLTPATATQLQRYFEARGIATRIRPDRPSTRAPVLAAIIAGVGAVTAGAALLGGNGILAIFVLLLSFTIAFAFARRRRRRRPSPDPLLRLRAAPAALPASDPWVARLAALLTADTAADVRPRIAQLALALQNLVDHRLTHHRERAEIDLVTAPIERLVALIEREAGRVHGIDRELATLDEGALVRAIARSEARAEPEHERAAIRLRLARLRVLEDARAAAFGRLLDGASLIERAVAMGLRVRDEGVEHERWVAAALQALDGE